MLLVSLCNVGPEGRPAVLAVDPESRSVRPLEVASGVGATGICRLGNDVVIAYQTPRARVGIVDAATLTLRAEAELDGTGDAHSVVPWGNGIAVASTASDEVVTYDYDGWAFSNRTVVWKASDALADTMHVNAIAAFDDTLVAAAFGPRTSPTGLWSHSRDGFVYDVFRGRYLLRDLAHPHSVVHAGGELFLCESARSTFRSADREIAQLDGYTRGIAFLRQGYAAVGTSRARSLSRSGGQLLNPADEGFEHGACALHLVDFHAGQRSTIPLEEFGSEIYEVYRLN